VKSIHTPWQSKTEYYPGNNRFNTHALRQAAIRMKTRASCRETFNPLIANSLSKSWVFVNKIPQRQSALIKFSLKTFLSTDRPTAHLSFARHLACGKLPRSGQTRWHWITLRGPMMGNEKLAAVYVANFSF
jgi:hypothetical protein